jgi:serine/threonine-protein kinase RsbW
MTDQIFSTTAADADFVCVDTADAHTVSRLRHELARWLETQVTLDADKLNDILLAVNEALTNAAEFAYRGRRGMMGLQVRYDRGDGTLIADVTDQGTWWHKDQASQPNTRGRGIPLMRALTDRTSIFKSPSGTHVQMEFGRCVSVRPDALMSA